MLSNQISGFGGNVACRKMREIHNIKSWKAADCSTGHFPAERPQSPCKPEPVQADPAQGCAVTDPFAPMPWLTGTAALPCPEGVLLHARFDPDAFHPGLFKDLSVTLPESLHTALPKRQAEFLAGRALARLALLRLGATETTIAIGADRAPVWPPGFAGSISHARGHAACLVRQGAALVGVDVETLLQGNALRAVRQLSCTPADRAVIDKAGWPEGMLETLVFSAKETLFKLLYPVVRLHFGFAAARLVAPPETGLITLALTETLHPDLPEGCRFALHYLQAEDHIISWATRPV